jgi:predicted TIM-barrel fold metal-dependent hydrolase
MAEREQVYRNITEDKGATIDAHVHAGFDATNVVRKRYPTSQSIVDLVRKMRANNVSYSAVFPAPSDLFWFDPKRVAYDAEWVQAREPAEAFPYERANWTHFNESELFGEEIVLPFGNIMPGVKEEEQVDFLRTYIDRDKVFGLKLHTLASHTPASALEGSRFIDLAKEYSLPITIHSGSDEYSDPQQVIELSKLYPDVRFAIAHAADFKKDIFTQLRANPHKNVFVDTCPHISNCYFAQRENPKKLLDLDYTDPQSALLGLYQAYPEGVIWGTDEPWTTVTDDTNQRILARIMYEDEVALLRQLPQQVRQQISYTNTVRFLFGDK